ncbi:hypothetical protein IV203_001989 [Nitzschia inconspicua]|uniref:Tudor domain-containing protein n=1 Tax=Nitzschia inconspicua TaxID=303405 RepID=A0A9K3LAJ2_9STRA|nr:hypothetical protein IV203_001989 [Nitzschia inconspicua]
MAEIKIRDSANANCVRIKANYKRQYTILSFDRADPLSVREMVATTCGRMHLKGSISEYALFVVHGKTNIRVFESSDLKDGDECELVKIQEEEEEEEDDDDDDDEDEDELDSADESDKRMAMSVEMIKPEYPSSKQITTQENEHADTGRNSAKVETNEHPSRPSQRGTHKKRPATADSEPPTSRRKVPTNYDDSTKNRRRSLRGRINNSITKSKGLVKITSQNQRDIEEDTLLIFERFGDGHFHEAIFKKYQSPKRQRREPTKCWVFVYIVDSKISERRWDRNWVDLNSFRSFTVDKEDIVVLGDHDDNNAADGSSLGKRLRVKWKNGRYYDGVVTKTLVSNKDFVFIEYDDGDQCWSNLSEELDVSELPADSTVNKKKKKATEKAPKI